MSDASITDRTPSTRSSFRDIRPYAPDARVSIDLSDNTNRWGAPPAAMRELQAINASSPARYPNPYAESLKTALARYSGVDESMIVTGCGSDDILDSSMRAFGDAGDEVAGLSPSFVMIPTFARLNGLRYTPVPLDSSYAIGVDAMTRSNARIIYLCSPNNPTGGLISRATIETVLDRATGVVIVDEAYFEFCGETVADLTAANPRLVVARTLSKAFGLAGLRVGYAIAAAETVREIEKSRGPFKISAASERAAAAAVTEDVQWVRDRAADAVASRDRLTALLHARSISTAPSSSNFVFAPIAGAARVAREMRALGVGVRDIEGLPPLSPALKASGGGAFRITVGPDHEVDAFISALDQAKRRLD